MLIVNTALSIDGFIIKGNLYRNVTADRMICSKMSQSYDISNIIFTSEKNRECSSTSNF